MIKCPYCSSENISNETIMYDYHCEDCGNGFNAPDSVIEDDIDYDDDDDFLDTDEDD